MTPLDDEFLPEEAKKTAIKLRKTTANLVRVFMAP
jgi:chromosome segregation ATPase